MNKMLALRLLFFALPTLSYTMENVDIDEQQTRFLESANICLRGNARLYDVSIKGGSSGDENFPIQLKVTLYLKIKGNVDPNVALKAFTDEFYNARPGTSSASSFSNSPEVPTLELAMQNLDVRK